MKRKKEVLMSVEEQYEDFMLTWAVQEEWGIIKYELVPYTTAKEEHHLIANAANKYYELVALNDEKTGCFCKT